MKPSPFPLIFFFLTIFANAQIPPNWELTPPQDTEAVKYTVGLSNPASTEQEAFKGAWNNALQNFAASIGTHFQGQTDVTARSEGYDSGIEDSYTVTLGPHEFLFEILYYSFS
jgi:hypothetical protein